ncbi:Ig-like domain-containing protein [Permianibacter aggregans]|uniref:Ig-like protein group 1 n=1 Tax=Permianibacter aggregans TaxID=1510150 RepID=A0A4V3D874_9GAMM|nr:Ig-like domain-containing protein [Permianibacter aggregans]QGX38840.1 hypothetical protein E2H98_03850 [Permianibacter aggregans]TDQ50647.1 Ig-like protein group 1 [Permianibacter aggregans]
MKVLFTRAWGFLIGALLLVACGGSGGPVGGETAPPPNAGPVPASITLFSDLGALRSSGADIANLTAIVKDANNVVISGATVNFAASSGSLAVTQPTTDAQGQAKATLGTSGNPANRTITVTATVAGTTLSQTLSIAVTGTVLNIAAPTSMASGDTQAITLTLRDADGNGIGGQAIALTSARSNTFSDANPITSATGSATVQYTATNGGSETVNATTLGGTVAASASFNISSESFLLQKISAGGQVETPPADIALSANGTIRLTWTSGGAGVQGNVTFTTTRGTVDGAASVTKATNSSGQTSVVVAATSAGPAVITATAANGTTAQIQVEFIATNPSAIAVNASPTSVAAGGKQSTINAVVRDAAGNLVKNQVVVFTLNDTTGGSIFPASAVTNSSGLASTVYTSSNTASATNGVQITATVQGTAVSGTVALTVSQTPLFISIGTGNELEEPDQSSYIKEFIVFITDSNGVARPNQSFVASVVPLPNTANPSFVEPGDADSAAYMKGVFVAGADSWIPAYSAFCRNEDADLDGVLDPGEDYNGNGMLTPGNQVGIDASSTFVTDAGGFAKVRLRYAQQYAYWMQARIRITATVNGTESIAQQNWVLEGIASDYRLNTAPPGRVFADGVVGSPFGRASTCANPN